jgi:hypothetical protein
MKYGVSDERVILPFHKEQRKNKRRKATWGYSTAE